MDPGAEKKPGIDAYGPYSRIPWQYPENDNRYKEVQCIERTFIYSGQLPILIYFVQNGERVIRDKGNAE